LQAAHQFGLPACVQARELSYAGCRCVRARFHSKLRCDKFFGGYSRIDKLGPQIFPCSEDRRGQNCHGEPDLRDDQHRPGLSESHTGTTCSDDPCVGL
jgi:hypothetical protein